MATTNTVRTYPKTDMVNDRVNESILQAEIEADAGITTTVSTVQEVGTDIVITFDGLLSSSEITALDAVIAAHTGDDFPSDLRYSASSVAQSDNSTNTPVEKLSIATDPLPAGRYRLSCLCEFDCSGTAPNTAAQVHLLYNGAEQLADTWEEIAAHSFSASMDIDIAGGNSITLALTFNKIGTGSLTAQCRRARMSIAPLRG